MSVTIDPDRVRGLYQKYRVEKVNGKPVGQCFVLEAHDPHAAVAVHAYAAHVSAENQTLAAELTAMADKWPLPKPITPAKFEPLVPVAMYQARCTNCGVIQDEYGDFSCMDAGSVISEVCNAGWFERTRNEPAPRSDNPNAVIVHTTELLCPNCQRCDVCGAERAYPSPEGDEHLVCEDHEDHDFGGGDK